MSAESDRDGSVERALRKSLSTRLSRQAVTPCLDPETLAAFADLDLATAQRETAEAHLADCARCQAALAALVRTAPAEIVARAWWRPVGAGWLIPLAAAATALVIWIAVPGQEAVPPPQLTSPVAPVSTPTAEAKPDDGRGRESVQAPAEQPQAVGEPKARQAEATAPASNAERPSASATPAPRQDATGVAAPESARAEAATADSVPSASASSPATAPPPSVSPPAARFSAGANAAAKAMLQANAAAEIVSPDPSSRWRITGGRVVERSTDGGATWQAQPTGATSELLAGSSPSQTVCWVVGRAGAVLLTTDGQRWQPVTFPEAADLSAVRASDARTAIVTAADGRAFRTTDAGRTWIR